MKNRGAKGMMMLPNGRMIFVDEFGQEMFDMDSDLDRSNPPRRKSDTRYSYSYDPFTIWGGPSSMCNESVWVDRMVSWDSEKYKKLIKSIFAENEPVFVQGCNGAKIEKLLQGYNDNQELKLLRVVEYCNQATGYPTWRIDYYNPKKK